MNEIQHINSISEAYRFLSIGKPAHPLVAVIDNECFSSHSMSINITLGVYVVSMKDSVSGTMRYGRSSYDFEEGNMLFLAPGQVVSPSDSLIEQQSTGWTLLLHPDLIRRTSLGSKISRYSFFSYSVNEALHISEQEKQTLAELVKHISRELEKGIDKHSETLISGTIELLLNYCERFYDRQFYTRSNMNKDIISKFEQLLTNYYHRQENLEHGLPNVAYCGKELGISPNYLSDLLKKETGKTAKEHIQIYIIDLAKTKLLGTNQSISQIAFNLGFDYPAHFTKLFKNITTQTPSQFRAHH